MPTELEGMRVVVEMEEGVETVEEETVAEEGRRREEKEWSGQIGELREERREDRRTRLDSCREVLLAWSGGR